MAKHERPDKAKLKAKPKHVDESDGASAPVPQPSAAVSEIASVGESAPEMGSLPTVAGRTALMSPVGADPVLLVHGGGWIGSNPPLGPTIDAVRAAGYRPIQVRYPLHDLAGADTFARRVARNVREDFGERPHAIGHSAGGVIVANLAARDLVRLCVCMGSPSDLTTWDYDPSALAAYMDPDSDEAQEAANWTSHWDRVPATMRERRRSSPTHAFAKYGTHPGLLVIHSTQDGMVPTPQANEMADASDGVLLTGAWGVHGDYFDARASDAIEWIDEAA